MIRPPRHPLVRGLVLVTVPTVVALAVAGAYLVWTRDPVPTRRGPTVAVPRTDLAGWMEQHEGYADRARSRRIPLLFLGDSITHGWVGREMTIDDGAESLALWNSLYGARGAENFGIGGDHVEYLLWRIRNGELRRPGPDSAVVMIGTNNIGLDSPEAIAEGVAAVVDEIRRRCPRTRVVLMGLLPRGTTMGYGRRPIDDVPDPRIAEINRRIAGLGRRDGVTYLDLGDRLLKPDGRLDPELQPDYLHLSRRGYEVWARAMEPIIGR